MKPEPLLPSMAALGVHGRVLAVRLLSTRSTADDEAK